MSCDKTQTTGTYTLVANTRKFEEKRAHKEQLKLAVALVASGEAGRARVGGGAGGRLHTFSDQDSL